jgi:glycosyltransferase involved in cell wall biosynthesis
MRVLVANKFFHRRGGAESVFFTVLEGLGERGHEVAPFSMQHPENEPTPYARYFVSEKNYEERHSLPRSIGLGLSLISSREAVRKIGALCRDFRPEIAHVHNVYHQLTPSILSELRRRGVPVVMSLHDYKVACPTYHLFRRGRPCEECVGGRFHRAALTLCADGSPGRSLLLATESAWHRWVGSYRRSVACFLAPSRFLERIMVRAGVPRERLRFFPNFLPAPAEVPTHAEPDGVPYVLFAGRLAPEKGVPVLLRAMRRVEARGRLLMAGAGPLRTEVERAMGELPADRIRLLGSLGSTELAGYRKGARAVVLPSLGYENAPMTALEAIADRIPLVASRTGGVPEYVREGREGVLVEPGEEVSLARAVESALRGGLETSSGESVAPGREAYLEDLEAVYRGVLS